MPKAVDGELQGTRVNAGSGWHVIYLYHLVLVDIPQTKSPGDDVATIHSPSITVAAARSILHDRVRLEAYCSRFTNIQAELAEEVTQETC
jgi:hypothetical protein